MVIKIINNKGKTFYINTDVVTVDKEQIEWQKFYGDSRVHTESISLTDDVKFLSINGDVIRSQHE